MVIMQSTSAPILMLCPSTKSGLCLLVAQSLRASFKQNLRILGKIAEGSNESSAISKRDLFLLVIVLDMAGDTLTWNPVAVARLK